MLNRTIYSKETSTTTALAKAVLSSFLTDGTPFNAPSKMRSQSEKDTEARQSSLQDTLEPCL